MKYGDKVKVINGFYEGQTGIIKYCMQEFLQQENKGPIILTNKYKIKINKLPFREMSDWIIEENIKLI